MTSYGTDVAFLTYAAARGYVEVAAADEADRDIARLAGSEYVDRQYRSGFPGLKTDGRDQDREWPRTGAVDVDGYAISSSTTPDEVERASYEAAYRELKSPGSLMPDVTPASQIKRKRVEGVIDTEYVTPRGPQAALPVISVIDAIMSPLTGGSASSVIGTAARS